MTKVYVSAAPGFYLAGKDDGQVWKIPIIAWAIDPNHLDQAFGDPVCLETKPDNATAIIDPLGHVTIPEDRSFDSVAEWLGDKFP